MAKVVFILGAGASRDCGAPLMYDFLDRATDLLWTGRVENKRQAFERVFKVIGALQAVHSKAQLDLNNIESIFTVLELGQIIKKVPSLDPDQIPSVIAALKELIVKTLEVTVSFPIIRGRISAPNSYAEFAKLLTYLKSKARPIQEVAIISFNYDIAVDMALFTAGLEPDYRLESGAVYSRESVPLLKLHGSLNWSSEVGSNVIRPLHLKDYFACYGPNLGSSEVNLPIGSILADYFSTHTSYKVNKEPVIVPPSWNKADYHVALSDIWASAAKHLSEAESIFIIGYSLPETDSFFRHLYALGSVGSVPLRRIEVFNPDSTGQVDSRFQSLLGPGALARYRYHPMVFSTAISHIRSYFPGQS